MSAKIDSAPSSGADELFRQFVIAPPEQMAPLHRPASLTVTEHHLRAYGDTPATRAAIDDTLRALGLHADPAPAPAPAATSEGEDAGSGVRCQARHRRPGDTRWCKLDDDHEGKHRAVNGLRW